MERWCGWGGPPRHPAPHPWICPRDGPRAPLLHPRSLTARARRRSSLSFGCALPRVALPHTCPPLFPLPIVPGQRRGATCDATTTIPPTPSPLLFAAAAWPFAFFAGCELVSPSVALLCCLLQSSSFSAISTVTICEFAWISRTSQGLSFGGRRAQPRSPRALIHRRGERGAPERGPPPSTAESTASRRGRPCPATIELRPARTAVPRRRCLRAHCRSGLPSVAPSPSPALACLSSSRFGWILIRVSFVIDFVEGSAGLFSSSSVHAELHSARCCLQSPAKDIAFAPFSDLPLGRARIR